MLRHQTFEICVRSVHTRTVSVVDADAEDKIVLRHADLDVHLDGHRTTGAEGDELAAFVVAGAFAGLAGALFGIFNRGVFADYVFWSKSAEVMIMTILGGMDYFWGPPVGALALVWLNQQTTSYTEYWPFVLGTLLVVLLYAFPGGIVGGIVDASRVVDASGSGGAASGIGRGAASGAPRPIDAQRLRVSGSVPASAHPPPNAPQPRRLRPHASLLLA